MSNISQNLFRQTISFCPECYKRIPAVVFIEADGVWMKKTCSEHGESVTMVERDPVFYSQIMKSGAQTIYPGYFIDVTEKCNLNCKYCYYPTNNKTKDKTIDAIAQNALIHGQLAPFILTGGEPTLRSDLSEIILTLQKIGPVELLTNGTGIKDLEKFGTLLNGDVFNINLSVHPEIKDDNLRVLELFRQCRKKIESILVVVDKVDQIDNVIDLCDEYRDVICATRIKAATKVWNEQSPNNKIFVSDLYNYITSRWGAKMTWWRPNKTSFVTTELNGIYHMLVSWYDAGNVDIADIACAPYYQAKTGETLNILTAMLVNEGILKGWLNGEKI